MEFLCPNHKRMFADLPLDNQQDLWLSWMEHSRSHSQQQDWDNVIALAGSAFDLACLARTRHPETMHVRRREAHGCLYTSCHYIFCHHTVTYKTNC